MKLKLKAELGLVASKTEMAVAALALASTTIAVVVAFWIGALSISTDAGGLDKNGFYLCPATGYYVPGTLDFIVEWENPLAPIFPSLVTDC